MEHCIAPVDANTSTYGFDWEVDAARLRSLEDSFAAAITKIVELEQRIDKAESRLDHVEPTVEGIDQTVQEICRQGGFDDYGDR